jgi:tetratricopeptide (TPR) repeat protein
MRSFEDFIASAWEEHADAPQQVAERLAASIERVDIAARVEPFARLVVHVFGEHLGQWQRGIALLEALRAGASGEAGPAANAALARGIAVLRLGGGSGAAALEALGIEDRIRVLATASSAFVAQDQVGRAIAAYADALALAVPGLPERSPALTALAVGGNNLAAALEERPLRSAEETAAMVDAAVSALKHWRLAGTWLEEERAEYRLARSWLQAGRVEEAQAAARRCIEVCLRNAAPPFELFFAHAVLALGLRAAGDVAAAKASRVEALRQYALVAPDEQAWCAAELKQLGE